MSRYASRHIPTIAVLAALALCTTGCVMHSGSLDMTRVNIEQQLPGARFDPEFQLTLGRMSMGLARSILNAADEEEGIEYLRNLRKVEVATYRTKSLPSVREAGFDIPHARRLKKKGWVPVVEMTDQSTATWVLFRQEKGQIRGLMVGALDDDELVLVKLTGNIQDIYDQLIRENILDVPGIVHADLDPEPGESIATVESQ